MKRLVFGGVLGVVCLAAAPLSGAQAQNGGGKAPHAPVSQQRGAHARASEAVPVAAEGQALYHANCAACHDSNGFATRILARRVPEGQAVLNTRTNLNRDFIRLIVRQGTGAMPQIRKTELPDADLDAIAAYLEKGR